MLEKITDILREYKEDDSLEVTVDTTFKDLELDSLDTVELVMSIEDAFGITIEMEEPIDTVGALIKIIEEAGK